jgi:GNAT superfamily N-acetyltransferase
VEVTVRWLHEGEISTASRLLARAFADDPIITHYLDDPVRREAALPAFFEGILEELLPSGQVFAASNAEDLIGVAAWLPPNPVEPDEEVRHRAVRAHRMVETLFPASFATMMDGFAALEGLHPADPHWYLAFVGIEPMVQGRGVGEVLLRPVLHAADVTTTLCYLETPFPRTHRFYERLGFSRSAEHHTFAGAPQGVVAFLRPPQ